MSYSHRERVLAAVNLQEPDRVPVDLMGNATMLLDATYLRLRDHLKLEPIPPVRSGTTANYYDERILDHFEIDFRRVFLKTSPVNKMIQHDDGTFSDGWGIRFQQVGPYVHAAESPFQGIPTLQDVENYPWPTSEQLYTADGLAEEARRLYQETDYAIVARNPLTYGFLDRACQLMEMPQFLMALALEPLVAEAIVAHLLEIYKGIYTLFLDAVGPYVHMVETGDDLGAQQNLIISPKMYRQFIKPAEQELYTLIHEKAPNAALFRHTDGAIFSIIPDLVDAGVNVLNPTQTSSKGMDGYELKKSYGEIVAFHGAIEGLDNEAVTVDDVVAQVKRRIDQLAPGGGYILASCNHLMDVEPELIEILFTAAREYGRYS